MRGMEIPGGRPLIQLHPRLILGSWKVKSGSAGCGGDPSHQLNMFIEQE